MDVGYNDAPNAFAAGIDRVVRALDDASVEQVVWITLRQRRSSWADINEPDPRGADALAAAPGRRLGRSRPSSGGERLRLALDPRRFHFFDSDLGERLADRALATAV